MVIPTIGHDSYATVLCAGSSVRTCVNACWCGLWRPPLVCTAQPLSLTLVDHWLKHVETASFFPSVPIPAPCGTLGFGTGWRAAQRTTWAAVPHWLRVDFPDGHCVDAQPQDYRAVLCDLHSGESLTKVEACTASYCQMCAPPHWFL